MSGIRNYYKLTKPGIVYGNVFTTIAAFLFALRWSPLSLATLVLFLATIIGLSFVIASACVFNNYLDRDLDARMKRTANRALVTGAISVRSALLFGTALGLIGLALLYTYVNFLSAEIALFGFLMYVLVYGFVKRKSHWGAVVGSIPGAVPIVVGYTAVMNQFDTTALILFLILVTWQMPHFYAIAVYRLDEYKSARIPVLPATKGVREAKIHILFYILAYIAATISLWAFGFAGYVYLASVTIFGLAWLWTGVTLLRSTNGGDTKATDIQRAKKLFFFSLIVLVTFCVTLSVAPLLP
jgi:protoheme IX farnesyltransferase